MSYFVNHTFSETAEKFGLTPRELKSLMTVSYRMPEFQHLRKETRTHNKWTVDELIYLLRHAGMRQRSWIADQINRGGPRVVKEKLMNLGVNTRTLNGMTLSKFRKVFACEPEVLIAGGAGPNRSGMPTCFKIVPWVYIHAALATGILRAPSAFILLVETMARFQKWIHGDDPIESLRIAATEGHTPPIIKRTYGMHHKI